MDEKLKQHLMKSVSPEAREALQRLDAKGMLTEQVMNVMVAAGQKIAVQRMAQETSDSKVPTAQSSRDRMLESAAKASGSTKEEMAEAAE